MVAGLVKLARECGPVWLPVMAGSGCLPGQAGPPHLQGLMEGGPSRQRPGGGIHLHL